MAVTKRETVADGSTVDGRYFELLRLTHDRKQANGQEETYAVDVAGNAKNPQSVNGFTNETEARRFITNYGYGNFTSFDRHGDKQTIKLDTLGVPSGLIREREEKKQSEPDKPPQTPATETTATAPQTPGASPVDSTRTPEGGNPETV